MSDWHPGPAWSFCPATRADRYLKALDAADMVILDLEDAVAPEDKTRARLAVRELAEAGQFDPDRTVVRINAVSTADYGDDIELTAAIAARRVMVAKAECADEVEALPHEVIVLLETPRGIERAEELASASNVIGLMWGADDLIAGMGGTASRHDNGRYRDVARYARCRSLIAAKAANRLALDAVHMNIPDLDGLRQECADAVASGFDATVAIHPTQLKTIRATYRPSPERVEWAERLLAHVGDNRGVATFEGRMVDGPIYAQANKTLRLAAMTERDARG